MLSVSRLQHDLSQLRTFWEVLQGLGANLALFPWGHWPKREVFSFCRAFTVVPNAFIHDGVVPSTKDFAGKIEKMKKRNEGPETG